MAPQLACSSSTWSSSAIAEPAVQAHFVADRGDAGHRLDLAILRHLAGAYGLSRSAARRLVDRGCVAVDGVVARRPAQRLAPGDVVAVDVVARPRPAAFSAEARPLQILYEDADLLVVVKPAGVVVHPTAVQRQGTLLNALAGHASARRAREAWTPHLLQRLDKDTSGVLAVAKSPRVHAAMQRAANDTTKEYLAVVWGRPDPPSGSLDGRLGRDPLDRRRVMVTTSGTAARTIYTRLASSGGAHGLSLVACRLVTGRTHQIRVHLAERGWPIVGDAVYGRAPRRRLADVGLDRAVRAFARQALHAWRLTLPLPSSGQLVRFDAPLPPDLADLLAAASLTLPRG